MALTRIRTSIRHLVLAVLATGATGLTVVAVAAPASGVPARPSLPAAPTPTIASVTDQLTTIGRQQEALTEKYNLAQTDVATKQKQAVAAQTAATTAARDYAISREQFRELVTAQYEGANYSAAGVLLTSQNGQNYLEKMSQLGLVATHRGDVVGQLDAAKATADTAQKAAAKAVKDATAVRDSVAAQKSAIEAQKTKFETLLATLTEQQRREYANRNAVPVATARALIAPTTTTGSTPTAPVKAGSAAAQKAVNFALAQVGKPYVFAAAGPDTYDCSGLTMAAWATAGVSLPHNAEAQYGYGTHVSLDALQPGDLVFLYLPIGHVEIYIGNGLAVSAPQEGEDVKVINVASPDNVGATRLT